MFSRLCFPYFIFMMLLCFYWFVQLCVPHRESLLQQGAVISETVLDDDYEDYEYEPGEWCSCKKSNVRAITLEKTSFYHSSDFFLWKLLYRDWVRCGSWVGRTLEFSSPNGQQDFNFSILPLTTSMFVLLEIDINSLRCWPAKRDLTFSLSHPCLSLDLYHIYRPWFLCMSVASRSLAYAGLTNFSLKLE